MAALIAVNCAEPSAATVTAFALIVAEEAGVDDEAGEELEAIVDEGLEAIVDEEVETIVDEGLDDVSDVDRSEDEELVEVTVEEADVSD
jgi:restriction endonuclease Mrr